MLTIDLYNQLRGTHFAATDHNMALINKLNSLGVTELEVKNYKMPAGSRQHEMRQMASDLAKTHKTPTTPAATPATKEEPKMPKTTQNATQSAEALIAALNGVLTAPALNEEEIKAIVEKAVEERLKTARPTRIEVATAKGVNPVQGTLHKRYQDIINFVSNGMPVYLYGPAGSGKTHLAAQIAEGLGLNFYYSGQLSQEYKFTGFTDANGRFQPTPFYKAWTEGGLFFLDEMDRSYCDVLTDLNGALANGIFDFPAPIGVKKMHPDFRCLAAGNTLGRGADGLYVAANALDASTLNRFVFVDMDYDPAIEDAIDKEAAEFVRVMRKSASLAGLDIVLSYRQITTLAKFADILGIAKTIKAAITAPLSKDDINILKRDNAMLALASAGNKYAKAFV